MVVEPVKRRVGEDDVIAPVSKPARHVAQLEPQAVAGKDHGAREHRLGAIDPDRLRRLEMAVQLARQLAGPAAEIDGAAARVGLDEVEEVPEGLRPLVLELLVTLWVPGVHPAADTSDHAARST